jgi:hypothetical protein
VFTSAVGAFGTGISWQVWVVVMVILIGGGMVWLISKNHKSGIVPG